MKNYITTFLIVVLSGFNGFAQMVQNNVDFSLDRIDQRNLPLNGSYNYLRDGSGVNGFIVDRPIRTTHIDFNGRATNDFITCTLLGEYDRHATQVAGMFGASTYGVAKNSSIHGVENCVAEWQIGDRTVNAANWITAYHLSHGKPSVAVLPYRAYGFTAEQKIAVENSINAGVVWVISAGNEPIDACTEFIPNGSIVVGAIAPDDTIANFSSFGTCVDIFAPYGGTTTNSGDDYATIQAFGTSITAPMAGGVIALLMEEDPSATPATLKQRLIDRSTKGKITGDLHGSPNRILYSLDTIIKGRVLKPSGAALSGCEVRLKDEAGNIRIANSSSFGRYSFENVVPYNNYTVSVVNKRYRFSSVYLENLTVSTDTVDFVGLE